jgi:hypothetical protein
VIWFGVWTLLVLLAVLVLGRLAWGVFRQGLALVAEMGEAASRLSAIAEAVERIGEDRTPAEPAVFADPVELRRQRDRRRREHRRRSAARARAGRHRR